jgi:hypothetical protein
MAPTPPAAVPDTTEALPPGTRFGELEVLRVLGAGGFGIVYLAFDHALQRHVALKEYLPSSLAGRGQGHAVSVRSSSHLETYAVGLRSFVNEARLLAQFNHPSLVKVYRFWEENGTAYMVMPYLQGQTLRDTRKAMSAPPDEAWIRSVIDPLLDALAAMHRQEVYHRDIAPDNILLPPGEPPVLLDFGAARRAIGDRTQAFTAIVKPSYAPIEQYADAGQQRQGPWTDLYALGAVMYFLLHGKPPTPATARVAHDEARLLDAAAHPQVSPRFVAAVEWALALRPAERPQSVAALREALDGRAPPPLSPRPPSASSQPMGPRPASAATADADATVVLPGSGATYAPTQPMQKTAAPTAAAAPRRKPLAAALALGMLGVAAGAAWLATHRPAAPTGPQGATSVPVRQPVAPAASAAAASAAPVPVQAATASGNAAASRAAPAEKKPAALVPHRAPPAAATRVAEPPPRRPEAAPANAPATPPTSVSDAPSGPASPREACGKRVLLALAHCMEQQCATPRFAQHPQCTRVRRIMEERRERIDNGD